MTTVKLLASDIENNCCAHTSDHYKNSAVISADFKFDFSASKGAAMNLRNMQSDSAVALGGMGSKDALLARDAHRFQFALINLFGVKPAGGGSCPRTELSVNTFNFKSPLGSYVCNFAPSNTNALQGINNLDTTVAENYFGSDANQINAHQNCQSPQRCCNYVAGTSGQNNRPQPEAREYNCGAEQSPATFGSESFTAAHSSIFSQAKLAHVGQVANV